MSTEIETSTELKKEQILNNDILNYLEQFEKFDEFGVLNLKSKLKLKKQLSDSENQIKKMIDGKIEIKNRIDTYNDEYGKLKESNIELINVLKEKLKL